jgi:exodeoxyribonuclease-3
MNPLSNLDRRYRPVFCDHDRAVLLLRDTHRVRYQGKCSFLPEERDWLRRLINWGLVDTFRQCYPETDDQFSWFDYRSRGFEATPPRGLRIDLILASAPLSMCCVDAGIDHDIRAMEKPSDHAPIWAEFDLG